jgi:glucosamine--fructose-6-phosphate aminotransferase (isomerizing)
VCWSKDARVSSAEPAVAPNEPGSRFLEEIREQPDALLRLLDCNTEFAAVASEMRRRRATTVRMVGHGSSDNAASYGVYAFGLLPHWTALRDSISLTVYYDAELDMSGCTALALSQSGRTPDVVEYARRAKRRGAFVVAFTNDPESELANECDAVLALRAGPEHAVAATKTYVNQVAGLGLLAAHAAGQGEAFADGVRVTADAMQELVDSVVTRIASIAIPFAYAGRMFVVGRGAEFATAREIALKLLETCRIAAEPLTATDLAHGPVAALDSLFPVWAIASDDATLPAVVEAVERAREAGATIIASGNAAAAIPRAEYLLPSPPAASPLLAPLLSIVPGQLFASALARARGLDPDAPRGLSKVTLAR